jgi:tetratricopeptide (TPR) repeat protein
MGAVVWSRWRRDRPEEERSLMKQAYAAWDAQDWASAAACLERLLADEPDGPQSGVWWFDAALAYKFLRDWPKAFELGRQAAARARRGAQDPAFWNLGIAATVLREWAVARDAWTGYGIKIPPGEGEISGDFGVACVRIQGEDQTEVVWAQRICPTRARVYSVPFDPSRRFGEVVLHDGVPNGERYVDGQRTPVFDEILLFEPSDVATLSASVVCRSPEDTEALVAAFIDEGLGADVLTDRYFICKCCSEGAVTQDDEAESGALRVVLGAPQADAERILRAWKQAAPGRREWANLHTAR